MKLIQIYKTESEYKIMTMYRAESGLYSADTPIYIVPVASDLNFISEKIFSALNESKSIPDEKEPPRGKELLKLIKEGSFLNLYKKSTSCMLSIDGDSFLIEPQICAGGDPKNGLEVAEDKVVRIPINVNKLEVTKKIADLLANVHSNT